MRKGAERTRSSLVARGGFFRIPVAGLSQFLRNPTAEMSQKPVLRLPDLKNKQNKEQPLLTETAALAACFIITGKLLLGL